MTCISPPALSDEQIAMFLDGEANAQVAAHLEHCPYCHERADDMARAHDELRTHLYRITCPSPETLRDYHFDFLSPTQVSDVTQHLARCPHCTRELAVLNDYLDEMVPSPLSRVVERVKVLIAELIGGGLTSPSPALAGVRGRAAEPYVYLADNVQIGIEVQEDVERPDRRMLVGLVAGMDTNEIQAHLWQSDRLISTTSVDEVGGFTFSQLAPGHYELILSGRQQKIFISDLQVET